MAVNITLRWAGALTATLDTNYDIQINSEAAGIGDAAWDGVVNQDATTPYAPVATTLNGGISNTATTVILASGTSLSEGDYIVVEGEMILLGVKAVATYTGCTRGVGGTLPIAHLTGAAVYKAHESYVDGARTFPVGRYALRYRIRREEADGMSVPAEIVVVDPPPPPFSNLITVWGVGETLQGQPAAGEVTVSISIPGAYGQDTGEHVAKKQEATELDADGFWYFFLRRDVVRQGGVYTIVFTPTDGAALTWTVSSLPDRDSVNWLET